jgi:hypothetical protein
MSKHVAARGAAKCGAARSATLIEWTRHAPPSHNAPPNLEAITHGQACPCASAAASADTLLQTTFAITPHILCRTDLEAQHAGVRVQSGGQRSVSRRARLQHSGLRGGSALGRRAAVV